MSETAASAGSTPNYDNEFDAIVVGAGLSGCTAALTMAREGLDVIVLERGPAPGTKNMFGGVLYTPLLRELVDVDDAPLERYVAEKRYSVLTDEDETALSMKPGSWRDAPHNDSYTVIRREFDEWLANQAAEEGATIITETTVTGLVREGGTDGRIVGVDTDRPDGRLLAPVVVLAEGANSLVSDTEGLRPEQPRKNVSVAVKEVHEFDTDVIEDRFRLDGDSGAAYNYFGVGAVGDAVGGGFIYTNKRTVSVGVVYRIEDAAVNRQSPEETLNAFKSHPAVAPLIRGGTLKEYSAHAIPEGGEMPELVHDGAVIVGDAAGLVLNNGLHLEGTNMAVESGYHAGKAIARARASGRADTPALASYADALTDSSISKNLAHYDWFHDQVATDRELLFERLPSALATAETEFFSVDDQPKEQHATRAKKSLLSAAGGWFGAVKLAWRYRRILS